MFITAKNGYKIYKIYSFFQINFCDNNSNIILFSTFMFRSMVWICCPPHFRVFTILSCLLKRRFVVLLLRQPKGLLSDLFCNI